MENRVEVSIKMDGRHMINFEVSIDDVNEIMRKYALVRHTEPKDINILDFLNFREN